VKVKFLEKDDRILPEMSAKVAFLERSVTLEEQNPKTALNSNAIMMNNNTRFVFLVNENRVYKTPLTTGSQIGDLIEVLNGVKSGDKVVVSPPKNLKHGTKIKMKEK
ncbi:MAG TPA: efflux RND transporter periplasmic adaptor subunit, partial [Candidatus Brocadiales bacterium]|nr:efflux RND transporter periplasmic adaptor subunit [Candidatus Brocadiales bacterium]